MHVLYILYNSQLQKLFASGIQFPVVFFCIFADLFELTVVIDWCYFLLCKMQLVS